MSKSYLFFIFPILLSLVLRTSHGALRDNPMVNTKVGVIRGLNADDGNYSMFMGIPFGKVDHKNPFGPSEPYPVFQEVFDAYDDSAICPQVEQFNHTFVGSLDCLHLNVYAPKSASYENPLPVMVWIYGGGFSIGFGGRYVFGPKYLVKHDVILVTFNYRLGPYGFMCTPQYPSNQGLKDQSLALRWIKENIKFFGGNPEEITIFGVSAGSFSVDYHVRSDNEKLFNKAIMESGTMILPELNKRPEEQSALKLAAVLGFETDDLSKAFGFLASVDPKQVIAGVSQVAETFEGKPFSLCTYIDNEFTDPELLLGKNVKILIGYNNDERGGDRNKYKNPVQEIINKLKSTFNFDDEKLEEMAEIVRNYYVEDKELDIVDFLSDYDFFYPAQRDIESFIQNGVKEVYQYVFSYTGGRNYMKRRNNITTGGAFHADEYGYLFDISFWPEEPALEDQLILDRMTTMWTNFAKYGNPTPETSQLLPVKWEPITSNSPLYYLNIDSEVSLETRAFNQRMTFLDLLYKANQQFVKSDNLFLNYK